MLQNIFFNRNLFTTIPSEESPYELTEKDDMAIVTAMNTRDTAALYSILQNFAYDVKIHAFVQYIVASANVAKTTKNLARDVDSPVSYTQKILENSRKKSSIIPPVEKQHHSIARTLWYYN